MKDLTNQELLEIYSQYLPYGVKVMQPSGTILQLSGMDRLSLFFEEDVNIYGHMENYSKLLLRPLSELTREIEHKGERFAPIIKLADFLGIKYTQYTILDNSVDFVLCNSYRRVNTKSKEPRKARFWYDGFKTRGFKCTDTGLMLYFDQVGVLRKLHEWHFDTDQIIDRGLALNLNDFEV